MEYFISESSIYRVLKAHNLITSLVYILMQAVDSFKNTPRRIHGLWQADFTYFRIVGWSGITCPQSLMIFHDRLSPGNSFLMIVSGVKETLGKAIENAGGKPCLRLS
jgi:hypothetical protein